MDCEIFTVALERLSNFCKWRKSNYILYLKAETVGDVSSFRQKDMQSVLGIDSPPKERLALSFYIRHQILGNSKDYMLKRWWFK